MINIIPVEQKQSHKKINIYNQDMEYADSKKVAEKVERFLRLKLKKIWKIDSVVSVKEKKLQYAGVDRLITVSGQQPLRIEEKIRRITRGDILVELIADNNYYLKSHRGLGWGLKPYSTDLLLYFFEDTETGHIFSWIKFQKTLMDNLPKWYDLAKNNSKGFSLKKAYNKGYYSLNIVIPRTIFLKKYKKCGGIIL